GAETCALTFWSRGDTSDPSLARCDIPSPDDPTQGQIITAEGRINHLFVLMTLTQDLQVPAPPALLLVGRGGVAPPVRREARVVALQEPLHQPPTLLALGQEHGPALHRHPAGVAARARLGEDADPGIALQVPHLAESVDADHHDAVRLRQQPHRHGERRAVGLYG